MIHEKLNLRFDIEKLRSHLEHEVFCRTPVKIGKNWGGWSVLSSNGKYTDGWEYPHFRDILENFEVIGIVDCFKSLFFDYGVECYKLPTEVCNGYLMTVMEEIEKMGFRPRKAKLAILRANGQIPFHQDRYNNDYAVRLHIPITTNVNSFFICEEGRAHMPADGSAYLVRINRPHKVINFGDSDRIHLLMDVWDTKGVSKYHKYNV